MSPKTVYSTTAIVEHGRAHGRGRSDDGTLDVALELPPELGGPGGATNPEQLFAVGYAACFASAVGSIVAKQTSLDVGQLTIASTVALVLEGELTSLAVELAVTLPGVTAADDAVAVVAAAHRICPYSRATDGNIEVTLTANGTTVDPEHAPALPT